MSLTTGSDWSIGRRLGVALGVTTGLSFLLIGYLLMVSVPRIERTADKSAAAYERLHAIGTIQNGSNELAVAVVAVAAQISDTEEAAWRARAATDSAVEGRNALHALRPTMSADEADLFDALAEPLDAYLVQFEQSTQLLETNDLAGLGAALADPAGRQQGLEVGEGLDRLAAAIEAEAEADEAARQTTAGQQRRNATIAGLIVLLAVVLTGSQIARGVRRSLRRSADSVAASADSIAAVGQGLSDAATGTAARAGDVAGSASHVAENVDSVSAAVVELQASIAEIARNAADAAAVAGDAVEAASSTTRTVEQLSTSSAEISQIVELIIGIAEQTNLLALNATIEAARAGEAGKGFAVVANEVKDLAKATASATESIGRTVQAIEGDSSNAAGAIAGISGIIDQIAELQNAISTAVHEQDQAMNDITRRLTDAGLEVAAIAESAGEVASASERTTEGAGVARDEARDLRSISGRLQQLVG